MRQACDGVVRAPWWCRVVVSVLVIVLVVNVQLIHSASYTNNFVVCLHEPDEQFARQHIHHCNMQYIEQVVGGCYLAVHHSVRRRSVSHNHTHVSALNNHRRVDFVQQQVVKRRVKRDLRSTSRDLRSTSRERVVSRRSITSNRGGDGEVLQSANVNIELNDPHWDQMWYLNRGRGLDMNVAGAWRQGFTGRGVVVSILDDGLEKNHPDLQLNYDPLASYDVNSRDNDPQPRYDLSNSNRHGTRCAGEVAGTANNSVCAVGVAYHANIGGVRMLDGEVTDAVEARSLSLNQQHIDIYSASWGPDDDGETVDGPGVLARRAFKEGIVNGRGGRGSIFVWASGNGGRERDNCNCDGYTNSVWTLSISSATERGRVPWYSEACSSTLATTYSSGSSDEAKGAISPIVTTDLHSRCTTTHTGTSASAPLAAGICALALQANKELTWRDMQHIVVRTARRANLQASDWVTNGVGRNVSHSFGYGLMDASAMVQLARHWVTVPEQRNCQVPSDYIGKMVPSHSKLVLSLHVTQCAGVNYMEHVQARVTLDAMRRGDVKLFLTSPAGTTSTLLARRPRDESRAGFMDWPFMTTHNWDESPIGTWTLEVHNDGRFPGQVRFSQWSLLLYGAAFNPNPVVVHVTAAVTTVAPPSPAVVLDASASEGSVMSRHVAVSARHSHSFTESPVEGGTASLSNWSLVIMGTEVLAGTVSPASLDQHPSTAAASSSSARAAVTTSSTTVTGVVVGCVAWQRAAGRHRACLECTGGQLVVPGSSECVLQCPDNSFSNSTHCLPCHYTCRTCHESSTCSTCHKDASLWRGVCVPLSLLRQSVVFDIRWWLMVVLGVFVTLVTGLLVSTATRMLRDSRRKVSECHADQYCNLGTGARSAASQECTQLLSDTD